MLINSSDHKVTTEVTEITGSMAQNGRQIGVADHSSYPANWKI